MGNGTMYEGRMVAYCERAAHQYGHTLFLDGHTAWIDDGGQLHVRFSVPGGGSEVVEPEVWNFVTEELEPHTVYPREQLPDLGANEYHKEFLEGPDGDY